MLILNRQKKSIEHRYFKDITDYLGKNDCLVMNNTKVVPARVFGKKETGGRVEVLFLSDSVDSKDEVLALVKPVLKSGVKILFPENITAFMGGGIKKCTKSDKNRWGKTRILVKQSWANASSSVYKKAKD